MVAERSVSFKICGDINFHIRIDNVDMSNDK